LTPEYSCLRWSAVGEPVQATPQADAHTTEHAKFDNLNVDEKVIQTINRFLFEVYCYAKEKNIPYLIDKSHRVSADLNAQFRRGRDFPGGQK
jgi:hypothetical protein